MSEQTNIERVVAIYQAFSRGDVGFIVEQLTPEVRWVSTLESIVPWSGTYVGQEEVPKFFAAIGAATEVHSFEWNEFVAQGDTVVSLGTFAGLVRSTGRVISTRWIFVWKFRDGKVTSYEQFHDGALASGFR